MSIKPIGSIFGFRSSELIYFYSTKFPRFWNLAYTLELLKNNLFLELLPTQTYFRLSMQIHSSCSTLGYLSNLQAQKVSQLFFTNNRNSIETNDLPMITAPDLSISEPVLHIFLSFLSIILFKVTKWVLLLETQRPLSG